MMESKLMHSVDRRLQTMAELISKTELCAVPNFLPPDFERRLNRIFGTRPVGKFVRVLDLSGEIGSRTENLDETKIPVGDNLCTTGPALYLKIAISKLIHTKTKIP
jgi:hypothetical protein